MGGDKGPQEVARGVLDAARRSQAHYFLVGDPAVLKPELARSRPCPRNVEVVPATQVIEMTELPIAAFKKKPDASVVVGARMVKEKQADALGYGDAYSYGTRRKTMADLKHLGRAVDTWAKEHNGAYPVCNGLDDVRNCLGRSLAKEQVASLHLDDAWGKPFMYWTDKEGKEYLLISYSTDGAWDGAGRTGPTDGLDCDIVFSNGDFAQWPGSFRKEEIQ